MRRPVGGSLNWTKPIKRRSFAAHYLWSMQLKYRGADAVSESYLYKWNIKNSEGTFFLRFLAFPVSQSSSSPELPILPSAWGARPGGVPPIHMLPTHISTKSGAFVLLEAPWVPQLLSWEPAEGKSNAALLGLRGHRRCGKGAFRSFRGSAMRQRSSATSNDTPCIYTGSRRRLGPTDSTESWVRSGWCGMHPSAAVKINLLPYLK